MRSNFSSLIDQNKIYFHSNAPLTELTELQMTKVTHLIPESPTKNSPSAEALTLHIYNFNFWSASWKFPFKKNLGIFGLGVFIIYYQTSRSEASGVSAAAILMLVISFPYFVNGCVKYSKFQVTTDLTRSAIKSYYK